MAALGSRDTRVLNAPVIRFRVFCPIFGLRVQVRSGAARAAEVLHEVVSAEAEGASTDDRVDAEEQVVVTLSLPNPAVCTPASAVVVGKINRNIPFRQGLQVLVV